MNLSRRQFLACTAATAVALAVPLRYDFRCIKWAGWSRRLSNEEMAALTSDRNKSFATYFDRDGLLRTVS